MKALNTLTFPLQGQSLIEASAGTGKTYTITQLYLRLVLGHGCKPLGVEQILVVTFTKAATAELKDRISKALIKTYREFLLEDSEDPFVQELIAATEDIQQARQRLFLACQQMDEAAIFTIHSFCQRMLSEHAFESGSLYQQQLVLDESEWLSTAAEDFWRSHISRLPADTLAMVLNQWPGPDAWVKQLRPLLYRDAQFVGDDVDITPLMEKYRNAVEQCKRWWKNETVSEILLKAGLKANTKVAKVENLRAMDEFCDSDELEFYRGKDSWAMFSTDAINKARKKNGPEFNLDFERFDYLHSLQQQCHQGLTLYFNRLAFNDIRQRLQSLKRRHNLLSTDDLLGHLLDALNLEGGDQLANAIARDYPLALIDEFQDTDPAQFGIFNRIYPPAMDEGKGLIMIGDPKQAIYAFRGADIFTYIKAKQQIPPERSFTLDTNWRSRAALVGAINTLFQRSQQGFMFEQDIPFNTVKAARDAEGLTLNQQSTEALNFIYLPGEDASPLSWEQASRSMAQACADDIAGALSAGLINNQRVKAGDCAVLVRDRNEAEWIKQALWQRGIASVFLVRKSVFATPIAQQLYGLMRVLHNPADDRAVRAALLSEMFCYSASEFDQLVNDDIAWQQLIERLWLWRQLWVKHGIMAALESCFRYFNIAEKLVRHFDDGMRRLTDLRHLQELLQQQAVQIQGEAQLLRWYQESLLAPDDNHELQQLRLETEQNLVQIVTMHSSKGLEYPLVWLPFVCRYRQGAQREAIFHDQQQQLLIDVLAQDSSVELAERERLAEDIRLLYVALTRGVYYCAVGLWNCAEGRKKSSAFNQTALGRVLLGDHQDISDEVIISCIEALAEEASIALNTISEPSLTVTESPEAKQPPAVKALHLDKPVQQQWRLTSYSAISHHQDHVPQPGYDETHELQPEIVTEPVASRFSFTKGAKAGSFLHGVLEQLDFTQADDISHWVEQQGQWFGIESDWWPVVERWLLEVLDTPLSDQGLRLSQIAPQQMIAELEFYLPLEQVKEQQFNQLMAQYRPRDFRPYSFEQLNGMLKGFVDLVFEHQGRFYVADYKSNHLGDSLQDYDQAAMEQAMSQHDYHLQAILYCLALHRWLSVRLQHYDIEQHLGGGYYLFLRGMSPHQENADEHYGVYYSRPPVELILALDKLFKGEAVPLNAGDDNEKGQLSLW